MLDAQVSLNITDSSTHPLETLVVGQLRELIVMERNIQRQLSIVRESEKGSQRSARLHAQVSNLRGRADRLYRMMNAL
ncbi:MAG: hypothetical protein JOZ62_12245 [Acidobacteriaceae bacterium]|nr:hypothetical protein [Acidobacteriaceae bacterium]